MGYALIIVAGLAGQLQESDLERKISDKKAELNRVEDELQDLWEEYYEDNDFGKMNLDVRLEYMWWSHDLDLENGVGFGARLSPWSISAVDSEGRGTYSRFSFLPIGFRFWSTRDEITGADVEVVTYGLGGFRMEMTSPDMAWMSYGLTAGLTRFRSPIPGVDSDSGLSLSSDFSVQFAIDSKMRVGFAGGWDGVKTSFRHPRTHTVHNFYGVVSWTMTF